MQGLQNSELPTLLQINFFYQNNCDEKETLFLKKDATVIWIGHIARQIGMKGPGYLV